MTNQTGPRGGCTFYFLGLVAIVASLVWMALT